LRHQTVGNQRLDSLFHRSVDADRNDANPLINPRAFDINKGNRQIAHGIWLVLRPIDI